MYKWLNKSALLRFVYFERTETERLLMLSALFSMAMSAVRIVYTGHNLFVWLNWNLFLAFVPYAISRNAIRRPGWVESNVKFAMVFVSWLLFIPNAFYIITDLFHLEKREGVPLWFDLALILSFAWNGFLLGVLSVRQMEHLIRTKFNAIKEWQFVYPMMVLNAFGIYIGRYLRYNSWDIVSNPFALSMDLFDLCFHPLRNRVEWSMILCYTVLITLMYITMKRLSKAVW